MHPDYGPKKEVVILLTDMVQYSERTSAMAPEEIRDFTIRYHQDIRDLIVMDGDDPIEIEPLAGDGALVIFDRRANEGRAKMCSRVVAAVERMACAIDAGRLPATRMGIYLGDIIQAKLGEKFLKFGSSFAVASRLEDLCSYFGTSFLMDLEVARCQEAETRFLVSVGRLTLQGLPSPLNVYTVYKPGINGCPADVDETRLLEFIRIKNRAMDLFCSDGSGGIVPDFPAVREKLLRAQERFLDLTGRKDLATERVLEYIRENPLPAGDFTYLGMKLASRRRDFNGVRLSRLSQQLLRALDVESYHALVVDTDWERSFILEWKKKDEIIVKVNEEADGIYYIDSGEADIFDEQGCLLATLAEGDIFGEMAYFSKTGKRNATVVAKTNMVVRKISSSDFQKLPVIDRIFKRIAQGRQSVSVVPGR
ncbi:MAG TPA: cyclic nucleotide-binding domain-containing protein [Desulfoprunum sp.]|nr:cyclic nucleotide-binding domain-containing protein [Desulfoprunum sp.]